MKNAIKLILVLGVTLVIIGYCALNSSFNMHEIEQLSNTEKQSKARTADLSHIEDKVEFCKNIKKSVLEYLTHFAKPEEAIENVRNNLYQRYDFCMEQGVDIRAEIDGKIIK